MLDGLITQRLSENHWNDQNAQCHDIFLPLVNNEKFCRYFR